MKANRKFLADEDEAVSPVIAVILMVAITVVLAATVYVWVSGFSGGNDSAAKSVAFTSASPIALAYDNAGDGSDNGTDQVKNYTISAATSGMKYSDIKLTLDGAAIACEDDTAAADSWRVMKGGSFVGSWVECTDAAGLGPDVTIGAGDRIQIYDAGGSLSGKTLRVIDADGNSVILTLTIG